MPSPSLTVAIASTQRRWHGGEEQARLLAVGLRQRGHRCVFLARRDGALAQRITADGFEVFSFSGGGRSPLALWQIRRCLRQVRPDVLHFNDSHALQGAGLAALGLRIPARIVARRVDFPLRSPRSYRWFSDRVVCVSRAVAKVCVAGGIPAEMLRVVHDGVDPARVRAGDRLRGRCSLALTDDQVLLLTVAKLTDHKGHRFLLDALPAVIQKVPNAVHALAGDGELREVLQEQAQRLGIQSHVRFLGYRDDVPDLIHAADLFVLPSHMEGLCSTLIDVMLAGRTIVTTTAGGISDLVGSDEPGAEPVAWTVPPCDSVRLVEAILRALASPDECAAMRQRACQRAERLFTADQMVEATLEVYQNVPRHL
jgi:glycosyltransferase involved in cell wall biosynthesis